VHTPDSLHILSVLHFSDRTYLVLCTCVLVTRCTSKLTSDGPGLVGDGQLVSHALASPIVARTRLTSGHASANRSAWITFNKVSIKSGMNVRRPVAQRAMLRSYNVAQWSW
jgi:hypothetical protein